VEGGDGTAGGGGETVGGDPSEGSSLTTSGGLPAIGQVYGGFRVSRVFRKSKEARGYGGGRPSVVGTDYSSPYVDAPDGAGRIFKHESGLDMYPSSNEEPLDQFAPQGRSIDKKPKSLQRSGPPANSSRLRDKGLVAYRKANR